MKPTLLAAFLALLAGACSGGGKSSDPAPCGPVQNTVASCGATCQVCPGTAGRQVATCDGIQCGLACVDDAPLCSDGTCSKLSWDFASGTVEGITPRFPNSLTLSVRTLLSNNALAMDVTNFVGEASFTVPICVTGSQNLSTKTLTASLYYQGASAGGDSANFVQASSPGPTGAYFLVQTPIAANATEVYSAPMSASAMSNSAATVVFQTGSLGESFTGTIWFDDIKIE